MTREDAIDYLTSLWGSDSTSIDETIALEMAIKALEQEPKTGHWIKISPADIFECSECGQNVMTSDICAYRYCHGCGVKMAESELQDDK